jgi:protein-tyrosine phosphatase
MPAVSRLLFVCYGNICRSPMAEVVFRHQAGLAGRAHEFEVDSAGIGALEGQEPHAGTLVTLGHHGLDGRALSSRRVRPEDLRDFDLVLALDRENLRDLEALGPSSHPLRLLLSYLPDAERLDVPDPFLVGGFEQVYELIDKSCAALLQEL